jgi:hypothetical protein
MKNKILYNILFFILYSFQLSPLYYWDNNIAENRRYYRALCRRYYYYFLGGGAACRIYGVLNVVLCAPCVALYYSARAVLLCAPCRRYYCHLLCVASALLLSGVSNIRRGASLLYCICAVSGPLVSGIYYASRDPPCRRVEYIAHIRDNLWIGAEKKVWIRTRKKGRIKCQTARCNSYMRRLYMR